MKHFIPLLMALSLVFCLFSCADVKSPEGDNTQDEHIYGKYLYVSPVGDDSNPGTESAPLASFAGARDAVRKIKAESGLPDGGICVLFADGEYKIDRTVEFSAEDSGEEGKPVTYKAKTPRGAVFNAGLALSASDFVPASEEIKAKLISDEAKEHLLEIDLVSAGITDLEEVGFCHGSGSNDVEDEIGTTEYTLYVGGKRQTAARWPNEGFYLNSGYVSMEEKDGYYLFTLEAPSENSHLWADETKRHYYGYPSWDYEGYYHNVTSADPDTGNITIEVSCDWIADTCPLYFFDMLCELDVPGEYYTDYATKKLYYYPDDGFAESGIMLTRLDEDIINGNDAEYLGFEGLVMQGTRNDAVSWHGNHLAFKDVEIRNIGLGAIFVDGCDLTVSDCCIHDIDGAGLEIRELDSDNENSQTNAIGYSNVIIYNNEIGPYGEKYGVSSPAVRTERCGTLISHNLIHGNRHNAISFNAQDVVIEYNEIYNCCSEIDDGGVITTGRNRDARGTVIRYNYIHDIRHGFGGHPKAIYLDDTTEQHTVFGNIIAGCDGRAMAISGDRYLTIENNILIDTENISWDSRGTTWLDSHHWDYPTGSMWVNLLKHPIFSALWRYSFPMNLVYSEASPHLPIYVDYFGTPAYANICRNVACNFKQDLYTAIAEQENESGMWETCYFRFGGIVAIHDNALKYGTFLDNATYQTEDEVGFVDYKNGNFNLREDSIVYRDIIGFEPIPFDEIGLVK